MKRLLSALALSAFAALSACGGGGAEDDMPENIEAAADNQAAALEAEAAALTAEAENATAAAAAALENEADASFEAGGNLAEANSANAQ